MNEYNKRETDLTDTGNKLVATGGEMKREKSKIGIGNEEV